MPPLCRLGADVARLRAALDAASPPPHRDAAWVQHDEGVGRRPQPGGVDSPHDDGLVDVPTTGGRSFVGAGLAGLVRNGPTVI
eukprot:gene48497-25238_t